MARRDSILLDGKEYMRTEIAAPAVNLSVKRLRELASGYRATKKVPHIKDQRQYYFHIPTLRLALIKIRGIDAKQQQDDIRNDEEHDYLEGL